MKPTKMRNNQIYRASLRTRSNQMGSALSKDLQKKYGKRSIRVVEGDTIKVVRGEYTDVSGKVSRVSTQACSVAIDGIKKEKGQGDKFDVLIHTSNVIVTGLNTSDSWRISRLEGKDFKQGSKEQAPEKESTEKKETAKGEPKEQAPEKESTEKKETAKGEPKEQAPEKESTEEEKTAKGEPDQPAKKSAEDDD